MKEFRVAEIFGPTIQGEGRHAGTPCHFIRFAGCDYRCSWCDSPHAVLPEFVNQAEKLSELDIFNRVTALPGHPRWVVFSGGNPLLFDLGDLINFLHMNKYQLMVETQGTIFKEWILRIDDVCLSPKPPSSGNMTSPFEIANFLLHFNNPAIPPGSQWYPYLKVVVFDEEDYLYALEMHLHFKMMPFFISVGNQDPALPTVGNPHPDINSDITLTRDWILDKTAWLMEKVANDPRMRDVRVLPQIHALAWGNVRGR